MSRTFHVGDLLSVTTPNLLSPRKLDGVQDLLEHLVGEHLDMHQLLLATRVCEPLLLETYPWLDGLFPPAGADQADLASWLAWVISVYGEWHEVDALPPMVWGEHDSFVDLLRLLVEQEQRRRAAASREAFADLGSALQRVGNAAAGLSAALGQLKPE